MWMDSDLAECSVSLGPRNIDSTGLLHGRLAANKVFFFLLLVTMFFVYCGLICYTDLLLDLQSFVIVFNLLHCNC